MSEPATPRGRQDGDEAPNKPLGNPWYQQKVPAYQPLLTPIKIAWILFGTGIVFIIIGLSVRSVDPTAIFTRTVQYDGAGTPSAASVASTRSWRSSARTPRCSSRSSC